jgi:polar amino acid transport system permease protein
VTGAVRREPGVVKADGPGPSDILERIDHAQRRRLWRFRALFVLTCALLIGGLVALLIYIGAFDAGFIATWGEFILGGAGLTILVSVVSIALAVVFALLGAMGRIARSAPVYAAATLYVSLVRGTPLIVQILFIYFALPQIWPGAAGIPAVALGIFALGFNYGAYVTEIFRAGIEAVPRGQREAAAALGMTQRRIMARIILPQAIRIVTPAVGNEFIAMIKDSSLVAFIGIQDLLWRARTVGSANFRMLETLLLAALVYWLLTIVFSYFQERLEQRMARADR